MTGAAVLFAGLATGLLISGDAAGWIAAAVSAGLVVIKESTRK